jgi:hypothetical protein
LTFAKTNAIGTRQERLDEARPGDLRVYRQVAYEIVAPIARFSP